MVVPPLTYNRSISPENYTPLSPTTPLASTLSPRNANLPACAVSQANSSFSHLIPLINTTLLSTVCLVVVLISPPFAEASIPGPSSLGRRNNAMVQRPQPTSRWTWSVISYYVAAQYRTCLRAELSLQLIRESRIIEQESNRVTTVITTIPEKLAALQRILTVIIYLHMTVDSQNAKI